MGLVHVILLFGTNNVQTAGLTAKQIHDRSIGSRLVLASRIFYAMFIWVSKWTVSEFLKRNVARASWKSSYQRGLHFIRIFLLVTFIAVVITTLCECQPFDHYWQVVPDPGPRCRQGFAQLITMGASDIITDLLLVLWPLPIIIRSRMPLKRKISLVLLFSLSLGLIGITATRMPEVISHRGRQQYRTVWASFEILASAAVANAVVLGSFVRDRGVKRNKYVAGNTMDSIDRVPTRRATIVPGSDEDLFRAIGCRVPSDLTDPETPVVRPAPAVLPIDTYFMSGASPFSPLALSRSGTSQVGPKDSKAFVELSEDSTQSPHDSADALPKSPLEISPSAPPPRRVSFWDVGGLLEDGSSQDASTTATTSQTSSSAAASLAGSGVVAHDFASRPSAPRSASSRNMFGDFGDRRRSSQQPERERQGSTVTAAGSRGILPDLGDRLTPGPDRRRSSQSQDPQASVDNARRLSTHTTGPAERRRSGHTTVPRLTEDQERGDSNVATAGQVIASAPRSNSRTSAAPGSSAVSLQDVGGLLG